MSELETPVGNRTASEVISDAVAESGTQWKRWTVGQRSDRPENACDTVMAALDTAGFAIVPVAERDAAVARVAELEAAIVRHREESTYGEDIDVEGEAQWYADEQLWGVLDPPSATDAPAAALPKDFCSICESFVEWSEEYGWTHVMSRGAGPDDYDHRVESAFRVCGFCGSRYDNADDNEAVYHQCGYCAAGERNRATGGR